MNTPIDMKKALKLTNGKTEVVAELIQLLSTDLESSMPQWQLSLEKQNWLDFSRLAHRLIGATSYVPAVQINALAHKLSKSIKSEPTYEKIKPIIDELIQESNRLINYANQHFPSS